MSTIGKRDFLKATSSGILLLSGAAPVAAQSGSQFTASNFQAPTSANVGQTVSATVLVENTGSEEASTTVRYRIADEQVASKSVTIADGATQSVALSGAVPSGVGTGTKTQGIFFDDQQAAAASSTIEISPSTPDYEVESIDTAQSEGRVGDSVSVSATIRNRGGSAGEQQFQYRIRGSVVEERTLQFNAGERRTVEFSGSVPNVPAGETRQGVFVGTTNAGVDRAFTVLADAASFSVRSFSSPSRIETGETVSVTARVRNTGGSSGTQTFRYRIDGRRVASREVTLDAGSTQTITLEGTVPDLSAGTYQHGVFVGSTDVGVSSSVQVGTGPSAWFRISNLEAPSSAEVGEEITVEARVTNTSSSRRETQIQYRIDGERIASQDVDIRAGQSQTVTFDVTVPDRRPTTYQQGVFVSTSSRGQTTSLRILPETRFTLSDLQAPRSARVGEEISVAVRVRNRGDSRATKTVEYRIGNRTVASRELELRSGNRETISFDVTVPELATGSYRHGVYVGQERLTSTLQVTARAEPEFSISNFSSDRRGAAGDTVSAEATVENTGTANGTITVDYRINGRILDASEVTVDADDSEVVELEGTVPNLSAGDYTQGVFIANTTRGQTRTFTVTEADDPDDGGADDADDADAPDETDDEAPGFGIGAGVAGTAGAAYLYSKYGGNEQSEQAE